MGAKIVPSFSLPLLIQAVCTSVGLTALLLAALEYGGFLTAAADQLQALFPYIREASANDKVTIVLKWVLTPKQHLVEWALLHALLLPLIYHLGRVPSRIDVPHVPPARAPSGGFLAACDTFFCGVAWVTGIATIFYKTHNGRGAYLLQPCHIQNDLLILLTLIPSQAVGSTIFNFYACTIYGAFLALATPDLRGLQYFLEVEAFFAQHAVLIILPLIWVIRRRYTLYASPAFVLRTWAIFFCVHLDVFLPLALVSGRNINYMVTPPKGALEWFGSNYRPVMGCVCILFGFLSRNVLIDGVLWVTGVRAEVSREAQETRALKSPRGRGGVAAVAAAAAGGEGGARKQRAGSIGEGGKAGAAAMFLSLPTVALSSTPVAVKELVATPKSAAKSSAAKSSATKAVTPAPASATKSPAVAAVKSATPKVRAASPAFIAAALAAASPAPQSGSRRARAGSEGGAVAVVSPAAHSRSGSAARSARKAVDVDVDEDEGEGGEEAEDGEVASPRGRSFAPASSSKPQQRPSSLKRHTVSSALKQRPRRV